MTIWMLVIYLIVEATHRMMNTDNIVIDSKIMLITSFVSLACNIFNLVVLGEDHDDPLGGADSSDEGNGKEENINVKAAIIHAVGDLLQSVGVIIAAIIITIWPEYKIVDPICTYLFSVIVMFTTIPVFKECISVLMEQQPDGLDS